MTVWPIPLDPPELYTVHDSTAESVSAVIDRKLPYVIRHNGKYHTILSPRYASEAEADCAALGLNHANERPGAPAPLRLLEEAAQ
jgi:hypothetical protein